MASQQAVELYLPPGDMQGGKEEGMVYYSMG